MIWSVKNDLKKNKTWKFVSHFLIALGIIYFYPAAKHSLFPDKMTSIEKLLRQSNMSNYQLAVDRQSDAKIILTVFSGGRSITTEIYRDVIQDQRSSGGNRVLFAHAINRNASDEFYLSRTHIKADADLKQIRRLEVTVCDRIKNQSGKVTYNGYEPVYECEVPILKAICLPAG